GHRRGLPVRLSQPRALRQGLPTGVRGIAVGDAPQHQARGQAARLRAAGTGRIGGRRVGGWLGTLRRAIRIACNIRGKTGRKLPAIPVNPTMSKPGINAARWNNVAIGTKTDGSWYIAI